MLRISKVSFYCVIVARMLLCAPVFAAQIMKEPVPPAPIPAQILTGRKAFIGYAGINSILLTSYITDHTGSRNGLYDEFYAAMKSWGRYELVTAPADADLILEISLNHESLNHESPAISDPYFGLKILDPRTHVVLWAFIETVQTGSGGEPGRRKAWDQALTSLVNKVRELAGQSIAPLAAPNK